MLENMETLDVIKLVAPLIFMQLALSIYCIVNIIKKGTRTLNKTIWLLIVIIPNTVTALAYLLLGKKRWEDD